ncbi:hypothetical protein DV515_00014285 [Chloebia gouldiae]|uniref:Uncharacterized protein n=1 Tax=Chloebia gouldiae TaxID=44316 RepID=A0A3L8RYH2_CHLGU|nr:hypothetical protein DV515_00014285 [Chloebia gouldiae]
MTEQTFPEQQIVPIAPCLPCVPPWPEAMAAANALLLASVAREIIQPGQKKCHHISRAMAKQMLEREVYLHQELIHLLQEIENSRIAEEGRFFSGWLFWTAAMALVLLAVICWLARRKRKRQSSPQSIRVFCPDLPEEIDEIEIGLSVYDHNQTRRNNLTLTRS